MFSYTQQTNIQSGTDSHLLHTTVVVKLTKMECTKDLWGTGTYIVAPWSSSTLHFRIDTGHIHYHGTMLKMALFFTDDSDFSLTWCMSFSEKNNVFTNVMQKHCAQNHFPICLHQNGSTESDFHPPSTLKGSAYFILYITEFLIIQLKILQ
jgi:hypothetical protein